MTETTQIDLDKVRAYLATSYRLGHTEQDIVLNIGERSERLVSFPLQAAPIAAPF